MARKDRTGNRKTRQQRAVRHIPDMKNLGDSNKKAQTKKPVEAAPVKVDL